MRLIYLATPYSKFPGGLEMAFVEACRITGELIRCGLHVYSPIAHTHPIARYGNLDPLDHDLWLGFDAAMMKACDEIYVATMRGWRQSKGVQYEIDAFKEANKPVFFIDPDSFIVRSLP